MDAATTLEAADIATILKTAAAPLSVSADRPRHRHPRRRHAASASRTSRSTSRSSMGHFPENPVFPGVLMIEGMAQTAGVIVHRVGRRRSTSRKHGVFSHHRQGQIPQAGVPGDTIEYHMTQDRRGARTCGGSAARPRSTAQLVAEAEVGAMIAETHEREPDRSHRADRGGRRDRRRTSRSAPSA